MRRLAGIAKGGAGLARGVVDRGVQLVRLPLDLGVAGGRRVRDLVGRDGEAATTVPERRPEERPAPRRRRAAAAPPVEQRPREWSPDEVSPAPPVEEHVSEESVLVGEFAETGAEQGVGANISIAEPWPGYDRMKARDVTDRLGGAGAEVVAAVRLYEGANRNRKAVMTAADRALRAIGS